MKKFLIIACMGLGLIACSSDDNEQSNEFEVVTMEINTIAHSDIIHDDLAGAGQEDIGQENKVITTATGWQELIDKINTYYGGNTSVITVLESVTIDFQQEEVLAVFEEVKMYLGYSIDITSVEEHEKEVVVTVERLKKGGIGAVITQPFHIVKISKVNKPVVFVEVD